AHDVPLGCAPDEYDDLISGTCSHLPKEKALVIVPGANHVDLYDNVAGKIPFATFAQFFKTNLK
ncbi:hypothetical protein VBS21_26010, partial [Klebsiella pneumoniae]|nr:hypothetical protein [Klebsiella pneumoniae]MEA4312124.1 hypothetical protein [Klebsiella pneumoniae]MEA4317468.1 hypothetical protein [Klebsiella pneumoniae]MEA4328012.1 hypothetical protein [Klebsiella pneumoniae]